jgi:hypothetical protein
LSKKIKPHYELVCLQEVMQIIRDTLGVGGGGGVAKVSPNIAWGGGGLAKMSHGGGSGVSKNVM